MTVLVLRADARRLPLPDGSVDLIVTSPPFWQLRSYTDGGVHYDGQIGSEPTWQEYIANLLDCTREWMRVLKPAGNLFVELGDVYSSGNRSAQMADYTGVKGRGVHRPGAASEWTTATAAWLAAVLDCEGSVSGRIFTNSSGGESFVTWMRVGMMDRQVVERIYEVTGVGQVFQDKRGVWNWHVASQAARYVLERIWPWLVIKQRRALAAIELCRHVEERAARGRRTLTSDDLSYRAMIVDAIRDWNGHPPRPNDYDPPVPVKIHLPHVAPNRTPAKCLMDLPHRYVIRCVDDLGLIKRAEIPWHHTNGLPESVTDRVRRAHSMIFHLVRQPRYYAAVDEIREPSGPETWAPTTHSQGKAEQRPDGYFPSPNSRPTEHARSGFKQGFRNPLGKLPGSVWSIPSQPLVVPAHLGVDHFAAFPLELPRRVILGWSPPGVCTVCGEGRRPVVDVDWQKVPHQMMERRALTDDERSEAAECFRNWQDDAGIPSRAVAELFPSRTGGLTGCVANWRQGLNLLTSEQVTVIEGRFGSVPERLRELVSLTRLVPVAEFQVNVGPPGSGRHRNREPAIRPDGYRAITGYACACPLPDAPTRPAIVLDPFAGTGTTMLAASALGRVGIGCDLSMDYARLARWRTQDRAEIAKAMQVPKPPPVMDGQEPLFT